MNEEEPQFPRDAACARWVHLNPDMENSWLKEFDFYAEKARRICEECPVRLICLLAAVEEAELAKNPDSGEYPPEGLRGGFFFENGAMTKAEYRKVQAEFGSLPIHVRRKYIPPDMRDTLEKDLD